jgi:hypothetical protein
MRHFKCGMLLRYTPKSLAWLHVAYHAFVSGEYVMIVGYPQKAEGMETWRVLTNSGPVQLGTWTLLKQFEQV